MPNFDVVASTVPTKPKRLQLVFDVTENGGGARTYAGSFDFAIPTSDGREIERRKGDLVPHLTPAQVTSIVAFLNLMMDKAQATVP